MSTYRAAIAHGVPLTSEEESCLPDIALVALAIIEGTKPEGLGVLLTEDEITIQEWTEL